MLLGKTYEFSICPAVVEEIDPFVTWMNRNLPHISFEISFAKPNVIEGMIYAEREIPISEKDLETIHREFSMIRVRELNNR